MGTGDIGPWTGMGEGDRWTGDMGNRGKLWKSMWCAKMIFVYAQPTSNQFSSMLSQWVTILCILSQWVLVTNFCLCSAYGEITTHFTTIIQNMSWACTERVLSLAEQTWKSFHRWLSQRGNETIRIWHSWFGCKSGKKLLIPTLLSWLCGLNRQYLPP